MPYIEPPSTESTESTEGTESTESLEETNRQLRRIEEALRQNYQDLLRLIDQQIQSATPLHPSRQQPQVCCASRAHNRNYIQGIYTTDPALFYATNSTEVTPPLENWINRLLRMFELPTEGTFEQRRQRVRSYIHMRLGCRFCGAGRGTTSL